MGVLSKGVLLHRGGGESGARAFVVAALAWLAMLMLLGLECSAVHWGPFGVQGWELLFCVCAGLLYASSEPLLFGQLLVCVWPHRFV